MLLLAISLCLQLQPGPLYRRYASDVGIGKMCRGTILSAYCNMTLQCLVAVEHARCTAFGCLRLQQQTLQMGLP